MSVDLEVVLSRPVRLGELIDHGRRVLTELLDGEAPELVVRDGARADRPLMSTAETEGRYVDGQIKMVPYDLSDPGTVIARTRLRAPVGDFGARCEQYLRQFPHLGGWPRDRSALF